jgi:hypothetical protein
LAKVGFYPKSRRYRETLAPLKSGSDFCVERLILAEPTVSTRGEPKRKHITG